jgi:hypothetical protein
MQTQIDHVTLRNFRKFKTFSLPLRSSNVLVGPNNSGKSSILDAFRILFGCYRYTRSVSPKLMETKARDVCSGYNVPEASIAVPLANISNDYNEDDAEIEFRHRNGNIIRILLHPDRPVRFILLTDRAPPRTPTNFRGLFPIDLVIVPTLAPFEESEPYLQDETIQRNESSRLASRYFRNIWHRKSADEFEVFRELVENSWDGVTILKPERRRRHPIEFEMFYKEDRIDREIFWSGFGFQVWVQVLTHLMRGTERSVVIVDEPDVYLHPDLQRKLLKILKERTGQYILATHSVEIINESDPGDVISINPRFRAGKRMATDEDYQALFNYIGSIENIEFSRLAKASRIIFFEGHDKKILRKFASKLGSKSFLLDVDTMILETGGFSQWRRVREVAWTFKNILKLNADIFVLFDRDYRPAEEIDEFVKAMCEEGMKCHVFSRKEIENYALSASLIGRTANLRLKSRELKELSAAEVTAIIDRLTSELKPNTASQIAAHKVRFQQDKGKDISTIIRESTAEFEKQWAIMETRLCLVSGKDFIASLSTYFQKTYGLSITINMLLDEILREEIDPNLEGIIVELDKFCGG